MNCLRSLHYAKSPILIFGAGARCPEARAFAELLGVPVLPTWGALDMFADAVGSFGTHGTRYGNMAVQNADWILSVGARLDSKATSTPAKNFAPHAKKFVVDIDFTELAKFSRLGIEVEAIESDAQIFLRDCIEGIEGLHAHEGSFPVFSGWREQVARWKRLYPVPDDGPYGLIRALSDKAQPGDIITCDTGCTVAWITQAWRFKHGQRLLHAWNQTPMGYALPAAIGAHYATGKPVLCITGDGSIMMNLGELASIKGLPVKVVLLDNKGHAMCRQTQRQWLGGVYAGTSIEGGLKFPDFRKLAQAFGVDMEVFDIDPDAEVEGQVKFGDALAVAA